MTSKNNSQEEVSLRFSELDGEESSIESELQSIEDDLKGGAWKDDSSDIDSENYEPEPEPSLGVPRWDDAESCESPLLSGDENDYDDGDDSSEALSDTLNDDDDDDRDQQRSQEIDKVVFPSFSSSPLSKISEGTRETSISGRMNSIRAGKDYRLTSPLGMIRNHVVDMKSPLQSPRKHGGLSTLHQAKVAIVEWDDGIGLDRGSFQGLKISDSTRNADDEANLSRRQGGITFGDGGIDPLDDL